MNKQNIYFWSKVETDLAIKIPNYLKNGFRLSGFRDAATWKAIDDDDINYVENFIRTKTLSIAQKIHEDNETTVHLVDFFGDIYASNPDEFEFPRGDRKLIKIITEHVKKIVDADGENTGLQQFSIDCGNVEPVQKSLAPMEQTIAISSDTHYFLKRMLDTANTNICREKNGFRYDEDIKRFACYLRMVSGRLAYDTLQKNLQHSLPSLPTIDRYIRKSDCHVNEGVLRCDELRLYLTQRNLPLVVSLSEDATRIVGRIQYDSSTNQLMGFVLPLNEENGMPIPFSYKARNAQEIIEHFTRGTPVASYVNVIMAQPLGTVQKFPPFCVLIFGSDNKYSHEDVCRRWKLIVYELNKLDINVLTISSDSDPRYNSSMRKLSSLGCESNWFSGSDWFSCGNEMANFPFFMQDMTHIATKLRNFFLKTIKSPEKLPFGRKFFIKQSHLRYLVDNFSKDKHFLTRSILNPIDKQNFDSVLRMTDERVTDMLRKNVVDSQGTIKFLEITRNIVDSYLDFRLTPLERVDKNFYALFMIRIWRAFIISRKGSTLKDNFLTLNCYTCIELNAHSLILCLLHLKRLNKPELFAPHLFGSQQCESYFRQIRSFTTTYSTVANCSLKEILGRISKIQLQNEITYNNSSHFKFPRLGSQSNNCLQIIEELPSEQDIYNVIEKSKKNAFQDAINLGLIKQKNIKNFDFSCKINPYINKMKFTVQPKWELNHLLIRTINLKKIMLKNFSDRFVNKEVEEDSPYVEAHRNNTTAARIIVKKISLCWMLRNDYLRISSDRLERVKSTARFQKRQFMGIYNPVRKSKSKKNILKVLGK